MLSLLPREEIQIDLDPGDILLEEKLKQVFYFVMGMGNCIGKQVVLTSENMDDCPLFQYIPEKERIDFINYYEDCVCVE